MRIGNPLYQTFCSNPTKRLVSVKSAGPDQLVRSYACRKPTGLPLLPISERKLSNKLTGLQDCLSGTHISGESGLYGY